MIRIMRNKKAILMPETLRIVLAVACIFLLLFLAVGLYGIFTKHQEIEQATAHMDALMGKIKDLEDKGVTGSFNYILYSPRNWVLTGWPNAGNKVEYCVTKGWDNCLCLCDPKSTKEGNDPDKLAIKCNMNKICGEVKSDILKVNPSTGGIFGSASDLNLIDIKELMEDYKGNLEITLTKHTDSLELNIMPQEVK